MTTMTNASLDKLLTVKEVAMVLKCCTRTVRRRINDEELPAIKLGRQLRIREQDLRRYLFERQCGRLQQ